MMQPGEGNRDSSLESAFMKLVQEIEKEYRNLPKGTRIRVEKWLEKLVLTGSNIVWRKNRNAYARLLLDMVINKRLSEPFHQLPPDGPLPSFPSHIQQQKGKSRDLLGPHESMFWRELYHKMEDVSEKSQYYRGGFHSEHPPFSMMDHAHFSREISNLNLVIKEQKIKIDLLEQQLKEERARHELQVQRMHQAHRLELARVLAKASTLSSKYSPPSSPRRSSDTSRSFNVSTSADYYRKVPSIAGNVPATTRSNDVNTSLQLSNAGDIYPNYLNMSHLDYAHSSDDERKTDAQKQTNSFAKTNSNNIAVANTDGRQNLYSSSLNTSLAFDRREPDQDIFPTRISKDSLALNDTFSSSLRHSTAVPPPAPSSSDEEFLTYLDGFQSQLKAAQIDTSLTVAAIQDTFSEPTTTTTTNNKNLHVNPTSVSSSVEYRPETSFDPTHPHFSDATLSPTRRSKETF